MTGTFTYDLQGLDIPTIPSHLPELPGVLSTQGLCRRVDLGVTSSRPGVPRLYTGGSWEGVLSSALCFECDLTSFVGFRSNTGTGITNGDGRVRSLDRIGVEVAPSGRGIFGVLLWRRGDKSGPFLIVLTFFSFNLRENSRLLLLFIANYRIKSRAL